MPLWITVHPCKMKGWHHQRFDAFHRYRAEISWYKFHNRESEGVVLFICGME